jgi:molecular chaperone GrpE
MSDEQAAPTETPETAPTSEETASPANDAAPPPPPVEDPVAVAKAETARVRDQLLRTAADFDNFRKRTRKELEDAHARGRESTVKDLLPVFDNLERAMQVGAASDAKAMADGLRIVLKQFIDTLERIGISRVQSVGAPFDPAQHEAIQHMESREHPAGTVVAEAQAGYAMGGRLVRAALVVVSKGAPSGEPAN